MGLLGPQGPGTRQDATYKQSDSIISIPVMVGPSNILCLGLENRQVPQLGTHTYARRIRMHVSGSRPAFEICAENNDMGHIRYAMKSI